MKWPRQFVYAFGAFTLGFGVLATSARLDAQNPSPAGSPLPVFEVASVKPNKSGEGFIRFGLQPGGRFTAQNVPARELIRFAYNVQPFQIEGGPNWLNSDRFDVTAKAEGELPPTGPGQSGPVQQMMQSLLADRFKLKVHRETKEMPVYALVLARSDGRLGKQIEPSTVDCAAQRGRGAGPGGRGGPGGASTHARRSRASARSAGCSWASATWAPATCRCSSWPSFCRSACSASSWTRPG